MKRYYFLVLLGVFIAVGSIVYWSDHFAAYPVIPIDSYGQAAQVLANADRQTLILFDIDDTLITSSDPFGQGKVPCWFKVRLLLAFPQLIYRSVREYAASRVWQQAHRFLIEPSIVQTIEQVKLQGCTVLGFTNMETGTYGVIADMAAWRYGMLCKMGVSFSDTYPDVIFTELTSHRGNYPVLFKGMLCTNKTSKGLVLAAFLDHFGMRPDKIIFFDDMKVNLQSVGAVCAKRNIDCILYLYQGFKQMHVPWDTKRALHQVCCLLKEGLWVTKVTS